MCVFVRDVLKYTSSEANLSVGVIGLDGDGGPVVSCRSLLAGAFDNRCISIRDAVVGIL